MKAETHCVCDRIGGIYGKTALDYAQDRSASGWEYPATAGTTTPFAFGNSLNCEETHLFWVRWYGQ